MGDTGPPYKIIHPRFTEFDQSWTYKYHQGWNCATHEFTREAKYGTLRVVILDPSDYEYINDLYEELRNSLNNLRTKKTMWGASYILPESGYEGEPWSYDELVEMTEELKFWHQICKKHNGEIVDTNQ